MRVLIVGSGGREHVLAWKIKQSKQVKSIYCAPGNGGTAEIAENLDIQATDIDALLAFAKEKNVDLTVVGPEAPLVEGIVDAFEVEGFKIFGPNKEAAQLEGSKAFTKDFLHECNIPTAQYKLFGHENEAIEFLAKAQYPIVIKADGLAAGKGVFICERKDDAKDAVQKIMSDKIFKEAGNKIVVEECLIGEEVSILAVCDGKNFQVMETSQDHKRIFDDDLGPNTGGMGAYSPAPLVDEKLRKTIEARIIEPSVRGMARRGSPFKGILYAGLMITAEGPKVLEFNVRFGDPEAQVVLARLENDIVDVMLASIDGNIGDLELKWDDRAAVCVVISAGGYPGSYEKDKVITGISEAEKNEDTIVFHAGTKKEGKEILTSGGRVLGVTSFGESIEKAIEQVYKSVEQISFEGCFFRRDIGAKALPLEGDQSKLMHR